MKQSASTSIATFGSCFSRRVADEYIKVFGGNLVSSVYHNRSDYFYKQHIKSRKSNETLLSLIDKLSSDSRYLPTSIMDDPLFILNNQRFENVGKHNLGFSDSFFEIVEGTSVDLFILDNYIDILARLHRDSTKRENVFFLPERNITPIASEYMNNNLMLGGLLKPEHGVKYMKKIIDYIYTHNKKATIAFINFPGSNYDLEKQKRFKDFEARFCHRHALSLPSVNISELCKTRNKQHFSNSIYSVYAGLISANAK